MIYREDKEKMYTLETEKERERWQSNFTIYIFNTLSFFLFLFLTLCSAWLTQNLTNYKLIYQSLYII